MTGRGTEQTAESGEQRRRLPETARRSRGFTLLELLIVMSIIVVLAAVALPLYQRYTLAARESVLRQNLMEMRRLIDQYAADKGKLPASLDDLVSARYMREVPVDPITGERDWQTETGDDPNLPRGGSGITNVHSSAAEDSTEGTPYNSW